MLVIGFDLAAVASIMLQRISELTTFILWHIFYHATETLAAIGRIVHHTA